MGSSKFAFASASRSVKTQRKLQVHATSKGGRWAWSPHCQPPRVAYVSRIAREGAAQVVIDTRGKRFTATGSMMKKIQAKNRSFNKIQYYSYGERGAESLYE